MLLLLPRVLLTAPNEQALAYHPDYLLRTTILDHMAQRWIALNPTGWNDYVIGLLRENQLAVAAEKLAEMRTLAIPIIPWIYSAMTHCLIANGEFAEALEMIETVSQEREVSLNTWQYLLQTASEEHNHETIAVVWERIVKEGYLNPSSGICEKILVTASRAGDFHLAAMVFQTLAQRQEGVSVDICEPMLHAYIESHDLERAVQLLCAMSENRTEIGEASLKLLVDTCYRQSQLEELDVLRVLRKLIGENPSLKKHVPIELLNSILEIRLLLSDARSAKEIFDDRSSICRASPNMRTYRLLLEACGQMRDLTSALQYYHQCRRLPTRERPDEAIFVTLINICIDANDYSQASKTFTAAQDSGISIRSSVIDEWKRRVGQQPSAQTKSAVSLIDKLNHSSIGQDVRKEIEILTGANEEDTQIAQVRGVKKKSEELEKARQRKISYAMRRWVKDKGRGFLNVEERKQIDQEKHAVEEDMWNEVSGMLDSAASMKTKT